MTICGLFDILSGFSTFRPQSSRLAFSDGRSAHWSADYERRSSDITCAQNLCFSLSVAQSDTSGENSSVQQTSAAMETRKKVSFHFNPLSETEEGAQSVNSRW